MMFIQLILNQSYDRALFQLPAHRPQVQLTWARPINLGNHQGLPGRIPKHTYNRLNISDISYSEKYTFGLKDG